MQTQTDYLDALWDKKIRPMQDGEVVLFDRTPTDRNHRPFPAIGIKREGLYWKALHTDGMRTFDVTMQQLFHLLQFIDE